MLPRSRFPQFLLLLICSAVFALGPVGCSRSGSKTRDSWWQFWRPKAVANTASIYHPDRVILPPPPDALETDTGRGTEALSFDSVGFLDPPAPVQDTGLTLIDLPPTEPVRRDVRGGVADLQTIYFGYDSFDLAGDIRRVLDDNLQWIRSHPNIEIQIEGHCDERGSLQYNLMLGERRAKAVKAYLVQQGVPESILHVISYGEERPEEFGLGEQAMSKNRRAQFLVY